MRHKSSNNGIVGRIQTGYAQRLDPPLIRKALQALLREQRAKHYQACERALLDNEPMPDRAEYGLANLERLLRIL